MDGNCIIFYTECKDFRHYKPFCSVFYSAFYKIIRNPSTLQLFW